MEDPYLLSTKASASANGSQILFLPLVPHTVHLSFIVACGLICEAFRVKQQSISAIIKHVLSTAVTTEGELTWFTFELALSVTQAGAAHHVTILSLAVPLLTNAVAITTVNAPL